jgi:hypothetical protein
MNAEEKKREGEAKPKASPPASGPAFDPGDQALLERIAGRVVRMGLAVPAVFFLESVKPLSFVGSQALVFFEPFVRAFLVLPDYERFTRLMEEREAIERLLSAIEGRDEEARAAERVAKDARNAERAAKRQAKQAAKQAADAARNRSRSRAKTRHP